MVSVTTTSFHKVGLLHHRSVCNRHSATFLYLFVVDLGRNPLGELFGNYIVGNPGCQPGLATSFQLVRLVGCGLYETFLVIVRPTILK